MGWFGFDDYDLDISAAGVLMPLDPLPEWELFGYSNFSDGQPSDLYDALEVETVKQNTRALYYAMTTDELVDDVTPAQGHDHNSEKTIVDYLPVLKMGGSNGLGGLGSYNGRSMVDSTTFKKWGWGVVVIPDGHIVRPVLFPKVKVSLNTHTNILDVKLTLYEAFDGTVTDINTTAIYVQIMRLDATVLAQDRVWFEGAPIQLVGLTAFPEINGKRLLYLKVETKVTSGEGILHEVELAWRYGL